MAYPYVYVGTSLGCKLINVDPLFLSVVGTLDLTPYYVNYPIDDPETNYLYILTNINLKKIEKTTLVVSASTVESCGLGTITLDSHSVYATATDNKTIQRWSKSTMALLATSSTFTSLQNCIKSDGTYLYTVDFNSPFKVYKLLCSDLSIVSTSAALSSSLNCRSLDVDDSFIYVQGDLKVHKLNKSDLSLVSSTSGATLYDGYVFLAHGNYIYVSGTGDKLYKLNKSDLSISASSAGGLITSVNDRIVVDDTYNYIYYASSDNKIHELLVSNLSGIGDTADLGYDLVGICLAKSITSYSTEDRVGSIRHIYRPGVYKAELTLGGLSSGIDTPDLYVPSGKLSSLTEKKEDTVPEKPAPPTTTNIPPSVQANIDAAIRDDNFTERLIKQTQQLPGGSIVQDITNNFINPLKRVWDRLFGGSDANK